MNVQDPERSCRTEHDRSFCINCGCLLSEDMKCCPKCGTVVENEKDNESASTERADSFSSAVTESIPEATQIHKVKKHSTRKISKRSYILMFAILSGLLIFRIICGSFSGHQYANNVEDGPGDMGARFNFTQDEFIKKYNSAVGNQMYQMPAQSTWEETLNTAEKTGTALNNYMWWIDKTYCTTTTVEKVSHKVEYIIIGISYSLYSENPQRFGAMAGEELMASLDVDKKGAIALYRNSAAVVASGGVPCYNNTIVELVVPEDASDVYFYITPVSDKVKKTIPNLEMISDQMIG